MPFQTYLFPLALGAALGVATVSPTLAQAPAAPVVTVGAVDINPAQYDWLSAGGQKALQGAIDSRKAGTLAAFVFVGAPGGDYWAYRYASKPTDAYSLADLARQALQACEFYANANCYVISVNGKEARDSNGSLPTQPRQLVQGPDAYDASLVPFMTPSDQTLLKAYASETKPKVLVISASQYWLWRTGATLFDAVAAAYTDCQKTFMNTTCILYAVNNRVVFVPGGPN